MNNLFSLLTIALTFGAGLLPATAQVPGDAIVRGVQLVSDAPSVDIYVDDITPATFQNVTYLSASRLLSVSPGEHNIKVAPAGTTKEAAVIEEDVVLNADSGYVLLATGRITAVDLQPVLLRRALSNEPAPGQTLVRFFNGSFGVEPLRVSIVDLANNGTEYSARAFRQSTGFRSIPGGAVRVYVRNAAGDTLYRASGSLATGGVITLISSGDPATDNFRISVLAEKGESAVSPMPTLTKIADTEIGEIRIVNMYAGDDQPLDVTIGGGGTTFPAMSFASASEILTLPAGELDLRITPTGESTPIYEGTITIVGGLYRAAYIMGSSEDGNEDVVVLTADATARPAAGQASVRFLNAYADSAFFPVWIRYANGSEKHIPLSSYRTFTPYEKVVPGNVRVRFQEDEAAGPVYTSNLLADTLYTIVVAPGNDRDVFLVNDDFRGASPELTKFGILLSVDSRSLTTAPVLRVAPNPTTGSIRVSVGSPVARAGTSVATLFDATGRVVARRSVETLRLDAGVPFDLSSLPAGIYQMVVTDEEEIIGVSRITVVQ